MSGNLKAIKRKIQSGVKPTGSEISELRECAQGGLEHVQGEAIYLLGIMQDWASLPELVKILSTTKSPHVASKALWTISRHFNEPQRVRSIIISILSNSYPNIEDIIGNLKLTAAKIAGDLIADDSGDSEVIRALVSTFEDEKSPPMVRDQAYRSLARLEGRDFETLDHATNVLPDYLVDREFIENLKAILRKRNS